MLKRNIGLAEITSDPENWDWHLDLKPGVTEDDLDKARQLVDELGLEIYDDKECEPDVLEDGTTRYWMSPKEPVPA